MRSALGRGCGQTPSPTICSTFRKHSKCRPDYIVRASSQAAIVSDMVLGGLRISCEAGVHCHSQIRHKLPLFACRYNRTRISSFTFETVPGPASSSNALWSPLTPFFFSIDRIAILWDRSSIERVDNLQLDAIVIVTYAAACIESVTSC